MKAALYAISFLSAAAALVFETLWLRQLGLLSGNGVQVASLVLSSFTTGLALGSALAARVANGWEDPLRSSAALEVAVAITGVVLVLLLPAVAAWFAPFFRVISSLPLVPGLLRFALPFAMLVVPATAIGAALLLRRRALRAMEPRFGAGLGALYGWNAAGAVAGVIATEMLLLRAFGVRGTALVAAVCSLASAVAAWRLSWRAPILEAPADDEVDVLWRLAAPWLGAAFLSGFAAVACQVAWFRFLLPCVRGTSAAFALMLAAALGGLALGGWSAAARLRRDEYAYQDASAAAMRAGVAGLLSYAALPIVLGRLGAAAPQTAGQAVVLAALLTVPTSYFAGSFFTLTGASLRESFPTEAATAAALGLAHAVGAALGALVAGFALLPGLGTDKSLAVLDLLFFVAGLLLWRVSGENLRRIVAPVILLAVACVAFSFASATSRHLDERAAGDDGASPSESTMEAGRERRLEAWLPLAVNPRIRHALVLRDGAGRTARALADTRDIETIDVVDSSPGAIEADRAALRSGGSAAGDSRVTFHVEDPRFYLEGSNRTFDLVASGPLAPGDVHLGTREFYQVMRERLSPGGMATVLLPVRDGSDAGTRAVIRAFCDVFEDCLLWQGGPRAMMMGSNGFGGGTTTEGFTAQWQDPAVRQELEAAGLGHPGQIGDLFVGGPAWLDELTANVPSLVDDDPKAFAAPFASGARAATPSPAWEKSAGEARRRLLEDGVVKRWLPRPIVDGAGKFPAWSDTAPPRRS